jgi:phosphoglycolate phosphatase
MNNQKLIIWDWNGTLLNDVDACVNAMNIMLKKRNMVSIDHQKYKSIFRFPVQDYYQDLGFNFDKESFEELSKEYIDLYKELSKKSKLHNGTKEVLKHFNDNGIIQIILSASEQKTLETQVKEREIESYFNALIGLDNIYAKSKLDNAKRFIQKSLINPNDIVLVGDTLHDYEVANDINCRCVLIQNGHQFLNRNCSDTTVLDSISELTTLKL